MVGASVKFTDAPKNNQLGKVQKMSDTERRTDHQPILEDVHAVHFYADDMGRAIAEASGGDQLEFLHAMYEASRKFSWPMQCRMIRTACDEAGVAVGPHIRGCVIQMLDTLLEHLRSEQ